MTDAHADAIALLQTAQKTRNTMARDQNVPLDVCRVTRENFDKIVAYASMFVYPHDVAPKKEVSYVMFDGIRFEPAPVELP